MSAEIIAPCQIAVEVTPPEQITVVVEQPEGLSVVTVAEQGPPGPPGPTAEGIRRITASPLPPENPQLGDVWIDTSPIGV